VQSTWRQDGLAVFHFAPFTFDWFNPGTPCGKNGAWRGAGYTLIYSKDLDILAKSGPKRYQKPSNSDQKT
jgi:hypothetical protein